MNALDAALARNVIQKLREDAKKLGISKLAHLSGIPQSTLFATLKEGSNPSFQNVVTIAFRLGYLVNLEKLSGSPE